MSPDVDTHRSVPCCTTDEAGKLVTHSMACMYRALQAAWLLQLKPDNVAGVKVFF
jgi:hypothetical protein